MVQFDIADSSAIEKLHSEIENDFGPVEILVNNAAILPSGLFINETFDQMKRMIDVNINAVILVIKLMCLKCEYIFIFSKSDPSFSIDDSCIFEDNDATS